ncbi:MAG TPA: 2OG-Fe(II) oxygenase [Cryomorphaceae bacterium]|nr:2OG-Fe(II) oxygenase [Owenweeksia sp.]MBF97378.1 2OG-Fe(II) oxygenase [Owenweeksia sp.]HAD95852.1 2OG-Fe(II) oxygenase [Cryomorphaceae bacterium]HBF18569.1 2OG-Fe(II) oxygenase [Cryomorphaceae bacterium]|tara:strand:+ start:147 stop:743 length:597 start_codon:yes stop_codon:yes gene_type:complete
MSNTNFNFSFGLPLKQNFAEYCYYESIFNMEEIGKVLSCWDEEKSIKATLSGEQQYRDDLRKSSVMFLDDSDERQWLYQKLMQLSLVSNSERFWFDLQGFFQELQLTRYEEGHFFDWHMDFGAGEISHRKLSITVQLSDPSEYEGGDLEFMINKEVVKAPRSRGTVIIFPSFVMHRVTPVTKGVRQSIVGWASGVPFR